MKYTTLLYRYSIVLLLGCTTSYGAWASPLTEKTRTIKETFEVDEFTTVDFRHRRGDLTVKHVSGSTGTIELKVIVRGEVDEDMQQLLDAIEADIDKSGNNVSIKTQTNIVSWSSSSWLFKQRHKIVLKNGKT
ncbi:MAG: hypothetical protein KJP00_07325, partial [Bacteroidia bacterium]|nr:hypothetical protein [Bacteroidia bacterium]